MRGWIRPALVGLLIVLAILAPVGQGNYITYMLNSWLIFSIAAMGLNLTLGYAGQISLAQASFMAIGAYTTALLTLAGWHWMVVVTARHRRVVVASALAMPGKR